MRRACGKRREASRQHLAVPAYWSPAFPAGREMFARLAGSAPAARIVVVNGSRSAPELPYHHDWGDTFRTLDAAGVIPLAYVDTGYLGVSFGEPGKATRVDGPGGGRADADAWMAQVIRDVDDWYVTYGAAGLRGVFLDRTTAVCGPGGAYVGLYRRLSAYVRRRHRNAYLVMNPGRTVERCYRDLADLLVTFEGSYDDYAHWRAAGWERDLPPQRFWHLVYAARDAGSMARAVALSKKRHVGHVYVADGTRTVDGLGHLWDRLPDEDYWRAQLRAAFGVDTAARVSPS